jgi:hypothetical protein
MASRRPETKYNHFGGFPSPLKLIAQLAKKAFPDKHRTLTQTLTMPRSNTIGRKGTIISEMDSTVEKEVPYISFAAVVGRNSRFEGLTGEQMDELGGVEYRALKALLWIVVGVSLLLLLQGKETPRYDRQCPSRADRTILPLCPARRFRHSRPIRLCTRSVRLRL